MKKSIVLLAVLVAFSSCAGMWKGMGVATEESVNAKIAELQKTVDELAVKAESAQTLSNRIAKLEALLAELQGRLDQLPVETLERIAQILSEAAAEAKSGAATKKPVAPTNP